MKISSPLTMSYPVPPRKMNGLLRYVVLAMLLLMGLFYLKRSATAWSAPTYMGTSPSVSAPISPDTKSEQAPLVSQPVVEAHPIDTLIEQAEKTFDDLLKKECHDLACAAAEYRNRRGRHPPPGFETWFTFAQENGGIIVEDFFDQIYHDLGPFWGYLPASMRKESRKYEMNINIRNHNASAGSTWFWTQIWLNLTQTIEHLLPDMDIALNAMDEPRIVVPWEEIDEYMQIERDTRTMPPAQDVIQSYQHLPPKEEGDDQVEVVPKDWEAERPYWKIASRGCPPESLARKSDLMTDFSHIPAISLAHASPHTYKGYVSNYSLATDFCHQPDLQSLHGAFIEPLSVSATGQLFPMFGGSKLPTNNEILLPAPMYWAGEERFSGGDNHGVPWLEKQNKVIWRGVATGGRNKPGNWRGFQRHRFVAMTNHTQVAKAESWEQIPQNFALPSSQYDLAAQDENRMGPWIQEWADTGFIDLMCEVAEPNGTCVYTDPYFRVTPGMKMADQFNRKYLPDIDGNSFSGRYRGFLMSSSLPIKATIFKEWHDSRLVPWKHFVPMDNRFLDFWGIMQYFLGYEGEGTRIEGHDAAAERIAVAGQDWANKVLRKEDMQIYVLRLLLEYARLSDDRREMMGYVQDLL
ncbi:capsule associated [Phlyctema vagabunda]|uniref:Capsule associated n=1 Tax=Phlyctema vagabunda TaxID=108571 RepID=A0ABR4PSV7_9HELO